MDLGTFIRELYEREEELAAGFAEVWGTHQESMAQFWSVSMQTRLLPLRELVDRYPAGDEPRREGKLRVFYGPRLGDAGLLVDLRELWLLVNDILFDYMLLQGVARRTRDDHLRTIAEWFPVETERQAKWLRKEIKALAREQFRD